MDSSAAPPGPAEGGAAAPTGGTSEPRVEPVAAGAEPAAARVESAAVGTEPAAAGAEPAAARVEADDGPVIAITGLAAADAPEAAGTAGETAGAARSAEAGGGAGAPMAAAERDVEEPAARDLAPAEPARPATPWAPSMWFMTVTAVIVAALDIGTKEWAKHALAGPDLRRTGKHIEAIPGYLDFIFAQNPGGAWSFLRGMPDGLRRPFFLFVSSAAIVFIVSVYRRLDRRQWAMRWGLPLALGGAIGNLADRVRYGWVVDFIDVYWKGGANEFHWPTFNVADIAIVLGVGLMAIDLFSLRRVKAADDAPAPATTASGAA